MPGLTSEPAVQTEGIRAAVPAPTCGDGADEEPWGNKTEISASFLSLGNGGPGRSHHSFAIAVRSVTCQGRAGGNAREERELVPAAPISLALAECTEAVPSCGGKVVFLPERVWK